MTKKQTFIEKIYKDNEGHIVFGQTPNIPIIVWFLSLVFAKIFPSGKSHDLFSAVAVGSLVVWALLELFQGANYFRRLLGIVVLVFIVASKLR